MRRASDVDTDFAAFYQATRGALVAQLYAVTGDLAEAQEAAQEAYLRAWQRWRSVRGYDNPAAWVRRVGYNLAVSRWRRTRRAMASWLRLGPPPDVPEPDVLDLALAEALRRLPLTQRRAIALYHLADLSIAEVAEVEQVSEGAVKNRLLRGRKALGELLSDEEPSVHGGSEVSGA